MRISLLRFFKTINMSWLMQFYGLFILLVHSLAKNLANVIFGLCDFFQVPKVALSKNPLYIVLFQKLFCNYNSVPARVYCTLHK